MEWVAAHVCADIGADDLAGGTGKTTSVRRPIHLRAAHVGGRCVGYTGVLAGRKIAQLRSETAPGEHNGQQQKPQGSLLRDGARACLSIGIKGR